MQAPKPRNTPKPHGKLGGDGLTDRERKFALIVRRRPEAPGWECAQEAGFAGDEAHLQRRASVLMKKGAVLALIRHPGTLEGEEQDPDQLTDNDVKKLVKRRFVNIVRSPKATDSDAIKAGDKLLCTIPGAYVPVQMETSGRLTLETLVGLMGGSPHAAALPPAEEEKEA